MSRWKMYGELAPWFHLLTAPADYAEEAALIAHLFGERGVEPDARVLELGSGGGNNASHLKSQFKLTLSDLSPEMLALSAGLNPECRHVEGDMRTLRLGEVFDGVLVHDAVMYLTEEAELREAMVTAWEHLRPGGVAVFMPDYTLETFKPETRHGGHDGDDGRSMRYLEWTTPPQDGAYEVAFAFMLREADGSLRCEHERQRFGVFPRALWEGLLVEIGFAVERESDAWGRDVFVGTRPR